MDLVKNLVVDRDRLENKHSDMTMLKNLSGL